MCNLYTMRGGMADAAALFDIAPDVAPLNIAAEVYPGYSGLTACDAQRSLALRAMTWGFPRRQVSKKTGKPLKPSPTNNARDDKLTTPFWRDSFLNRRCLIPLSAWAEAEGEPGRMTRTWYALPDSDLTDAGLFTVAGLWRPTDEWGDAYTMVMTDSSPQMSDAHDRMPVILRRDQWDAWLRGAPDAARDLVRTYAGALTVTRTDERWSARSAKLDESPAAATQLPF